jgi:hypothetical protein
LSAYADTSFLVSLYVLDANSPAAAAKVKHAHLPVLLTSFGEVELANALYLWLFRKELVPSKVKAARALFAKDTENGIFLLRPLFPVVFERAKLISRKQTPHLGTRTTASLACPANKLFGFLSHCFHVYKRHGLA